MIFCNSGPISAACQIDKATVESAHAAVFKAITDLTSLNRDLSMDFGFVKLNVTNKNLTYKY